MGPKVSNAFILLTFLHLHSAAGLKPHILLVVADDLGWADHSIYVGEDGTDIPTPNLRRLANSGVTLSNYYVQQVCSPTRTALMTGRFPFRVGMQHSTTILPGSTAHVPLETPMLPEMLKTEGYNTHMIGKWHLGYAKEEFTPMGRGFDSHLGYYQAMCDYYKKTVGLKSVGLPLNGFDFWFNGQPWRDAAGNYSLDQYMTRFKRVVEDYALGHRSIQMQSKSPLFVYFAHQTVHIPIQYRGIENACAHIVSSARRDYCNMIVEFDQALAETVEIMKAHGLWNNTLMLVTTDNGGMVNFHSNGTHYPDSAASAGSNFPLRGSKTTMFEGGVRGTALY